MPNLSWQNWSGLIYFINGIFLFLAGLKVWMSSGKVEATMARYNTLITDTDHKALMEMTFGKFSIEEEDQTMHMAQQKKSVKEYYQSCLEIFQKYYREQQDHEMAQQKRMNSSWTSSLLKCLTYTSTSVMVIKLYIKVIWFFHLLWLKADKDADEWIGDWGPFCNFIGRVIMQIPAAGFVLRSIWGLPNFCYDLITSSFGLITSTMGSVASIDYKKIEKIFVTPVVSMWGEAVVMMFKPLYWIWSFWAGCWGLVTWIYELDNKWIVFILLAVIFLGDLCKASLVIQRLEAEQEMLEYKKEMKEVKKKTLSPGANPKKLKKFRAKNSGSSKLENTIDSLALENKKTNKNIQKVNSVDKHPERKIEKKNEEVDDSCLEVCKMLINFCHDPKRKKEVIANIKKRGFADNDDIMKLINDASSDKGEAENNDRAKKLMDTIQEGKSKYYNQLDSEEKKKKTKFTAKVYPPGVNTQIEKRFHDIYDDVQKLDKTKVDAIKNAKNNDTVEVIEHKSEAEVNNNKVDKEGTDENEDKKATKKKCGRKVRICWKCDKESSELWKCGGCRKAWYCDDQCLRSDWEHHGSYCNKMQEKRKKKNSAVNTSPENNACAIDDEVD